MTETLPLTDRSRLRRMHDLGRFDVATIHAILDAQPLCTVAYVRDGKPYLTPTLLWREGDRVYWHGSSASHALRAGKGQDVCMNVTILDGFVLARSGFNHSVNTRSVTLFGIAEVVPEEEKAAHLTAMIEAGHVFAFSADGSVDCRSRMYSLTKAGIDRAKRLKEMSE